MVIQVTDNQWAELTYDSWPARPKSRKRDTQLLVAACRAYGLQTMRRRVDAFLSIVAKYGVDPKYTIGIPRFVGSATCPDDQFRIWLSDQEATMARGYRVRDSEIPWQPVLMGVFLSRAKDVKSWGECALKSRLRQLYRKAHSEREERTLGGFIGILEGECDHAANRIESGEKGLEDPDVSVFLAFDRLCIDHFKEIIKEAREHGAATWENINGNQ